jgi:putative transposase
MPNLRRFNLPGIPQHVVQRGNNRQACFLSEQDYLEYLLRLAGASEKHGVDVHAYVLMRNHIHILATPVRADGVGKMMQAVGSGYVRSFNAQYQRTGTLWDGRYFGSVVGSDAYLWNCHRYIEMNPVRAGIVDRPEDYRWSSFARNALGRADPVVAPHPAYGALGASPHLAYRALFDEPLPEGTILQIRERLLKERGYGAEDFLANVESLAARSPRCRAKGRPW